MCNNSSDGHFHYGTLHAYRAEILHPRISSLKVGGVIVALLGWSVFVS